MRYVSLVVCSASLCLLSSRLVAADAVGSVTSVIDGKHIQIQMAPAPKMGDRVEVVAEIPGLDLAVTVAEGKVVSIRGELASVDLTKVNKPVTIGSTVKVISAQDPDGQPQPPTNPKPKPDPATKSRMVVTFNELQVGDQDNDVLGAYGIAEVASGENQPQVFAAAQFHVMPPGLRNLLSAGSTSTRTSVLTIKFAIPLKSFEIVRVGILNGSSLPKWQLKAIDSRGKVLDTVGEADWGSDPTPKRFVVSAPRGMTEVRIEADNRWQDTTYATHSALPIAEMVLVPLKGSLRKPQSNDLPPGLEPVPGN